MRVDLGGEIVFSGMKKFVFPSLFLDLFGSDKYWLKFLTYFVRFSPRTIEIVAESFFTYEDLVSVFGNDI